MLEFALALLATLTVGALLWPLLVGPMLAKYYLLTGDLVAAPEAARLAMGDHVRVPRTIDAHWQNASLEK